MSNTSRVFIICGILISIFIGGFFGWIMKGEGGLYKSMAWGFEEKSQLWNRIRVDEKGYVLCHKD